MRVRCGRGKGSMANSGRGMSDKGKNRIVDASAGILRVKPSPLGKRLRRLEFSTIWGEGVMDLNRAQREQLIRMLQGDQ